MADPTTQSWTAVRGFMERACGVVMDKDQHYLLDARLQPVARKYAFASVGDFVRAACGAPSHGELARALVDAMTTHETSFFRDQGFWKAFGDIVLPALRARALAGRTIRFWSAACSDGQEAYSLAMLLAESWPEVAARADIVATDVSAACIERAETAVYSTLEVNRGLAASRLVRHFEGVPGGFRVKEHLRKRVRFARHNLLATQPDPTECDVIFCRNVLIYFGDSDRALTERRLRQAGRRDGYIAVGTTEQLRGASFAPGWYHIDESHQMRTR